MGALCFHIQKRVQRGWSWGDQNATSAAQTKLGPYPSALCYLHSTLFWRIKRRAERVFVLPGRRNFLFFFAIHYSNPIPIFQISSQSLQKLNCFTKKEKKVRGRQSQQKGGSTAEGDGLSPYKVSSISLRYQPPAGKAPDSYHRSSS